MSDSSNEKEYAHQGVTIVWTSSLCIHSGNCVKNLKSVFKPKQRPWIQMEHASSEEIVHAVKQCPSGALRIKEDV